MDEAGKGQQIERPSGTFAGIRVVPRPGTEVFDITYPDGKQTIANQDTVNGFIAAHRRLTEEVQKNNS
jgi:hypothetical protein